MGDSGEENSLLTGRNLQQNQTQKGRPSASTGWGFRGQERGGQQVHEIRIEILAEK